MNFKRTFFRCLCIYVAVSVSALTPLAGIGRVEAAIGVKSLLVGGLVGGAALLALGALSGPAGLIGSVGAAGTGFSGILGGAVGGMVGGTAGAMSGLGVIGSVALGLAGAFLGAHFLAPALAGISPFILIPAVLIGGGLLVYSFITRRQKYGTTYDSRFQDPTDTALLNARSRLANQSQTGSTVGSTSGSLLDKFRSIFDRNRRDDQFWWDQRYVDGNGYVRYNQDIWGKLDRFFNGRNSGFDSTDLRSFGVGYGNTAYLGSNGGVPTDQAGRVVMGGETTVQTSTRTGLTPSAPESASLTEANADEALKVAQEKRSAAYNKLISTLKEKKSTKASATAGAAPSVPGISDPAVLEAIREYREADRVIKELEKRLQPQEKQ